MRSTHGHGSPPGLGGGKGRLGHVDEIFGLSMTVIMVVLAVMLAICLLSVAWIALRQGVVFKLGVRNIPRRKTQTALIIVGLMLSTVITTAALGMGDTVDRSLTAATFDTLGEVDELVVSSPDLEGDINNAVSTKIPAESFQIVEQALADNPDVDGLMPALFEFVPAINSRTELSTPQVYLIGIDPDRVEDFGGLRTPGGEVIDLTGLLQTEVVISESAAEVLDAVVGDQIMIFYEGQPAPLTVKAIAKNSPLSGVLDPTINPGMVVPLDRLQTGTGQEGLLSFIGISNTGNVRSGVERTDAVVDALEGALAGSGLGIDAIKQDLIEQTELASSGLTGLFLVLGLFSISVGVLLIVLIFAMLAAERRPEMGMARAVGQQRRQLIQQFIAEGAGYALLSGLVGAGIGVAVTFALGAIFGSVVGDFFKVEAVVTPRSAIIGYCLGVVITFAAVIVSSWRASRLNVVAAIRDIPDVTVYKRNRRLLYWNILLTIFAVSVLLFGQISGILAFHGIGFSLTLFGIAFIARYFGAPVRPVLSLLGLLILTYWLLPADIFESIFGDVTGDFELFFISGIFMVAAATILIVQNLDSLLGLLSRIGGLFPQRLPAVRMAIAYPSAAKGRTGLTIAMFSLIVFSLVCFATISENFANLFLSDEADAGWDVEVDVISNNQLPNKDLIAALNAAGADTSDIVAVGWSDFAAPQAVVRQDGVSGDETVGVTLHGMDASFISESEISFQARAEGYDDDEAIIDALLTEPNVAVIDSSAVAGEGGFGAPETFHIEGVGTDQEVFPAVHVAVTDPETGQPVPLRIIGIIDSDISTLFGLFTNRSFTDDVFPNAPATFYRVRLSDPGQAKERAKVFERALLTSGAQAISFDEILEQGQAQFRGFLTLIQGFMGLGLFVGIAAVGVIAFRAVVERRQQIGLLRALGFQRSLVAQSFLFETVFVVALGVISGTILAIALARELFSDEEFTGGQEAEFVVPWLLVVGILVIAFVMAIVMTWVPSRQAASVAPAEALRYE